MTNEEAAAILEDEAEYLYATDEPYNRQAFKMAIEALKERKMGKWIETGYIDGTNVLDGKCSYCGEWIDVKRKSVVGCLRYCPFCGEKMEVDE